MIGEHKASYAGYAVEQWNDGPLKEPLITAYRLAVDDEDAETWPEKLARFVAQEGAGDVAALIVGAWWGTAWQSPTDSVIEALVIYHQRLLNLKALFIGDVTYEECEISWINQSDMSPLLLAYPRLEHFGVRGTDQLRFGRMKHDHLTSFTLESGGTDVALIDAIVSADFPSLVDLELWTGDTHYGANSTLDDLRSVIMGEAFPSLRRLAIRNCEYADDVAQLLVRSPLFDQLETLDLSLGTLGDDGARALLAHPAIKRLKTLNIDHHYCSEEVLAQIEALEASGLEVLAEPVDTDWQDEDDDDRYVAVGE